MSPIAVHVPCFDSLFLQQPKGGLLAALENLAGFLGRERAGLSNFHLKFKFVHLNPVDEPLDHGRREAVVLAENAFDDLERLLAFGHLGESVHDPIIA